MSGRISNFVSWAPTGTPNYPPGGAAWNGNPIRVPSVARYFTPGVILSPQELNAILGEMGDAIAALVNGGGGQGAALNWRTLDSGRGFNVRGMTYDRAWGRWYNWGDSTANNTSVVEMSTDGGVSWNAQGAQNPSTGTVTTKVQGLIARPSDGRLAIATFVGTGDVTPVTDELVRLTISNSGGVPLAGAYFAGQFLFAGRDGSVFILKTSSGGAWADHAGSSTLGALTGWGNTCPTYFLATSPTKVMGVNGATANGQFILSSDALLWSAGTFPIVAGESVVGLDYAGDRWAIAVTNGTDSRILTSTDDGTTWAVAATLTGYVLGGMAACGALLFATSYVHFDIRGIYSTDGGVTWNCGTSYRATPASGTQPDRVYSSGATFATASTARVCVSYSQGGA